VTFDRDLWPWLLTLRAKIDDSAQGLCFREINRSFTVLLLFLLYLTSMLIAALIAVRLLTDRPINSLYNFRPSVLSDSISRRNVEPAN